ncbi:MAG: hypothetical protein MdMp024_0571 [Bacteroidales bacterium]
MKANFEKVLSFLIELARLFLAWKKGGNRVWGMGYRVWGKTSKTESKTPETEAGNCLARGRKGTGKSVKSGRKKVSKTADAVSHHTPTPIPQPPKNSDSGSADANDAACGIPGGDGDSAGSNGGAAVAMGEIGYGVWGMGYGEEKEPQTPATKTPDGVFPHTPSPIPHTPLKLLGWGLMLYAGIRLLGRF